MKYPALPALLGLTLLSACQPSDGKNNNQTQTQTPTPPAQVQPQTTKDPQSGLKWMNVTDLPSEGQRVYTLIKQGGPFKYSKDATTFGNREGILPKQGRAYYREYTVKTPGESDRGARRIICGGQPETSINDCYYTSDHYSSFRRIRP